MTRTAARKALDDYTLVCGGAPGTQDYDEGQILAIKGDLATVAWRSGVRTDIPIADLSDAS